MGTELFGYFDNNSDTPTYDPGINVPCVLCFKSLNYPIEKIVTTSFSAFFDYAEKSYFYRAHKSCYEEAEKTFDEKGDSDVSNLEASIMAELGTVQNFEREGLYLK